MSKEFFEKFRLAWVPKPKTDDSPKENNDVLINVQSKEELISKINDELDVAKIRIERILRDEMC